MLREEYALQHVALKLEGSLHLVQDGPGKFVCGGLSAHVARPRGPGLPFISLPVQQRKLKYCTHPLYGEEK
jgi:hypothetical protein